MSRTDVTARAAPGAGVVQCSVVTTGAWLQIPSAAPGVFRVRPLPFEAIASYAQRLAATYQLTLPQLLDGTGITLQGHGAPPTAELSLNYNAARLLAALARIPLPHLRHALPRLALSDAATHDAEAASCWKRLEAGRSLSAPALCAPSTKAAAPPTPPGYTRHPTGCCARATIKPPPTHDSPPPSAPKPRPNSPPRTTLTNASCDTPAPSPPGPQHAPSPPAGTTTSNTSPTAGISA